jgi:molybdenum cofactor cytidylyltransferase
MMLQYSDSMPRTLRHPAGDLWCIVLAAGGSSRLGSSKQLVRRNNRPLMLRALELATSVAPTRTAVVLGADALRLRGLLRRHDPSARVVSNSGWREGIAASLRAGIRALPADAAAALILLTDQALLTQADLERLLAAWRARPAQPAAACYAGGVGVPAILPRAFWRSVRSLRGDAGARKVLRAAEAVTLVDMPNAAFDVDTPADVDALTRAAAIRRRDAGGARHN